MVVLNKATQDILSGTAGGVAQVFVGQPFDMVKVRLQTGGHPSSISTCVSDIYKQRGLLGFYRGTLTPLLGVGACVSIQFGVVGAMKRFFVERNKRHDPVHADTLSTTQLYLSGAVAGLANSVVAGPIEQIRIRLQAQQGHSAIRGPGDCIRQIVQQGGVTGIFRGMTATMLREGHGLGVYFLTYEALVQRQLQGRSRSELSSTMAMLFGASAGVALWLSAYPIDVVKSKMQTDHMAPHQRAFPTTWHCITSIYKTAGVGGFFRGLVPTLLRAPFANAATFVAVEAASRRLESYGPMRAV